MLSCTETNRATSGVLKNVPITQDQKALRTAGARLEVTSLRCELSVLIFPCQDTSLLVKHLICSFLTTSMLQYF